MATITRKNILITGGTGLVGSHLIEALQPYKPNILSISRSFNPRSYFASKHLHQRVIQVMVDLKDEARITDIVTRFRPEYIIHLAAQPLVDVAYVNPIETLMTNIMGTSYLLEAARKVSRLKGIIVASSDKAYGKLEKASYKETDPLKGDHPYEVSKSSCDLVAHMYFKTYGLPIVTTRFGNIYGPGDLNFSRIIPKLCRALIFRHLVRLRSDGTFIRDYLFVKDVADGYLRILTSIDKHVGESFNFGSPENMSVTQVIKAAEKIVGKKIKYKILNTQKNEIPRQSLQYAKARRLLHWRPKFRFSAAFKLTLDWYRNYFAS